MRLLIFSSLILFLSCAGQQNILSDKLDTDNSNLNISSDDINNSYIADLTTEIRKFPTVNVRGIGPRASIYLRNQSCKPLFLLNGAIIQDYYTLYHAVDLEREKIVEVKVVPPRQAVIYGLRSSSGVILITTDSTVITGE
jgi:hypothetical protein